MFSEKPKSRITLYLTWFNLLCPMFLLLIAFLGRTLQWEMGGGSFADVLTFIVAWSYLLLTPVTIGIVLTLLFWKKPWNRNARLVVGAVHILLLLGWFYVWLIMWMGS